MYDKYIKDSVSKLQQVGIETTASCQGYRDYGEKYPWIDIKKEGVEKISEFLKFNNNITIEAMGAFGDGRLRSVEGLSLKNGRSTLNCFVCFVYERLKNESFTDTSICP